MVPRLLYSSLWAHMISFLSMARGISMVLACVILFNASILMYLEDKDFHLFCMSQIQNGTSACLHDQHCGLSVNLVIVQLYHPAHVSCILELRQENC